MAFTREQRFTVEPAGQPGSICLFDNELLLSAYFTSQLFCASPRGNCAAEPSDELRLRLTSGAVRPAALTHNDRAAVIVPLQ